MYTVKISGGCRESLYLKGTLSLFCSLIVCSRQEVSGLLSVEMTSHHPFQSYLAAISLETPSCCLLTNDGGRFQVYFLSHLHAHFTCFHSFPLFQVQPHLLSVLSPFLATLLAQVGNLPILSLPCSEKILRLNFDLLSYVV